MKTNQIKLIVLLTALMTSAAHAADYTVTAFHDGTEVASGTLVDLFTGVNGASMALSDVTLTADLVEVDGGLNVCGSTIQALHQKWCVPVKDYVKK